METVRFDRPERVAFRLVRGPVPHVIERFQLTEHQGGTQLAYDTTVRWRLTCGGLVSGAPAWSPAAGGPAVAGSLAAVKDEAERRARGR